MSVEPTILHADLDSFYASVEQRDDPALRGRPVIVGAGVVLAASYPAKAFGVRTAMGVRAARALCPAAVVVPPRMAAYTQASRDVFAVFEDTTPLVEPMSIDEAFLDVGGLRRLSGPPERIAARLRAAVRDRVGLPITVGVARTKFLAKVASRVGKPDGLLVVRPERELEFLHPLPVRALWGVGRVTEAKLLDHGLRTVGEVAALDEATLISILGPASGHHLHALSHAVDPRRVAPGRRRRSIGAQRAWAGGFAEPDAAAAVAALTDRVMRRLRSAGRVCRTVTLRLRFADFSRAARSRTLPRATDDTETVLTALVLLYEESRATIARRGLTMVGVALSGLDDEATRQLELPFEPDRGHDLDVALDRIRDRFGAAAVGRAVLLGAGDGIVVPLLPD